MIISHEYEFIFLKTKKTAGTSMEIALSRVAGPRDVITPIGPFDPASESLRSETGRGPQNYKLPHVVCSMDYRVLAKCEQCLRSIAKFALRYDDPLAVFQNHNTAAKVKSLVKSHIWNQYSKFCFVRNPWDMAISQYFFQSSIGNTDDNFDEWLINRSARNLTNWHIYTVTDLLAVDHVGYYEDISDEWERICNLIGLPEEAMELPKAKGDRRRDYTAPSEFMSDASIEYIRERCAKEIKQWGYEPW